MSRSLTIISLYPRQLGINGDSGNVLALRVRAEARGIDVTVVEHNVGDTLPESVDLVHIGSGPRTAQLAVQADLALITPRLAAWKNAGVPVVAIAGGWQLLGSSIVDETGERFAAAGLFPTTSTLVAKRAVGEIVVSTEWGTVAGFENHGAVTTLDAGASPFGTVTAGHGNAGAASSAGLSLEGVVDGASIGTHLHGPLLPMNPVIADRLLKAALENRGFDTALDGGETLAGIDLAASNSRAAIAKRLGL
ncbi:glutamine amidotransferase [Conyzicola nivalis]|uniref:Lipid II isoglutaminyl synthase (glutamine-hydrolyzing) subunit GatD n=1 Tax=Conyzicola nivalis TaxID=1477021 RepID=A0A916WFX7_9MICO|nr:cobyric acid synthase [Conyzicola nivalis]GGA97036.1 glutamine amidotransferase [Conyzicola nivalis]